MPFVSSSRGTFGAQSKTFKSPPVITVSPAIGGISSFSLGAANLVFDTPGEYTCQILFADSFYAKVWGAGGCGGGRGWDNSWDAGSGGFSKGTITLGAGTTFKVIVGETGQIPDNTSPFGGSICSFGGGGPSQPPNKSNGDPQYSGGGGGFSGIMSGSSTIHTTSDCTNSPYKTSGTQARSILIAGGGGGGGNTTSTGSASRPCYGGHGGGLEGTGGYARSGLRTSSAGTQSRTGNDPQLDGSWGPSLPTTLSNYGIPGFMQGSTGEGETYGGGGGGGYFGGMCAGTSTNSAYYTMGGGGGGSGYLHPTIVTNGSTSAGSARTTPGGSGESGYVSPTGHGGVAVRSAGSGNRGGNGRVVLSVGSF